MARIGRLAGAIVVETAGAWFLVGDLKGPCDFPEWGFARPPEEITGIDPAVVQLRATGSPRLAEPYLSVRAEGPAVAEAMASRMLIARNGSVSERLWSMVIERGAVARDDGNEAGYSVVEERAGADPASSRGAVVADWLVEVPSSVWEVVRDQILRCS